MSRKIIIGALTLAALFVAVGLVLKQKDEKLAMPVPQGIAAAVVSPLQELHAIIPQDETPSELPPSTSTSSQKAVSISPRASSTSAGAIAVDQEQAVSRIKDPYATPQLPPAAINATTRSALVNIMCMPSGGSMHPISGSGVLIDPRGIILTNAHVAQYVLLSEDEDVNLSCVIRTGSPASSKWIAEVVYLPPVWAQEHASELNTSRPLGTGEHDYAFLRIIASAGSAPLPATFPFVSPDSREAIGFLNDKVMAAGYPAEFLGGMGMQDNLFAASSFSSIRQLITFGTSSVDSISLGGVIEAQSGSSGGAVVNMWGRLIGMISTMTDGTTTSQRDLRAITMSYIDHDLTLQTGMNMDAFLAGSIDAREQDFNDRLAPDILQLYAPRLHTAQ